MFNVFLGHSTGFMFLLARKKKIKLPFFQTFHPHNSTYYNQVKEKDVLKDDRVRN